MKNSQFFFFWIYSELNRFFFWTGLLSGENWQSSPIGFKQLGPDFQLKSKTIIKLDGWITGIEMVWPKGGSCKGVELSTQQSVT